MKSKTAFVARLISIALFSLHLSLISADAAQNTSKPDVVINVVGDVHGEPAIDRRAILTLRKYFQYGDLNIFNLETAVTRQTQKEDKAYNFRTNLAFLTSLKSVGFNLANIANNHTYDYGQAGFIDTLNNLDKVGISYVGGGMTRESAYQGRIFTVKGLKIGVLGFAKVNGGAQSIAGKNKPGMTNGYDATSTSNAIKQMRALSDVVMILAHWGEEKSPCPRGTEMASAKRWISEGADIIVGSHTHTIQPITFDKNTLVAYSMGNFIFYSSQLENRSTGILSIRITPERKISYIFKPFLINNVTKVPEFSLNSVLDKVDCKNYAKTTVR